MKQDQIHYDTKWQFCSYWHQIDEIIQLKPTSLLHVGVGTKFLDRYLLERGVPLISLDIEESREPDVVGNVLALPFPARSFEVVACFEVLEHLPFSSFRSALRELKRVTRRKVVLSLPDVHRFYVCNVTIPFYGTVRRVFTVYWGRSQNKKICKEHFWEMGLANYSISKIRRCLSSLFVMEKEYRVFEKPYHRFFVLQPRS